MRRGIAAAFAAVVLIGATAGSARAEAPASGAPPPRASVPAPAQTAVVRRYLDAIATGRYTDAFALLEPAGRAYFGTPQHFGSTFRADGFALLSYRVVSSAAPAAAPGAPARVFRVRERVRLNDPARDAPGTATIDATYGVLGNTASASVRDLGRPWKSFSVNVPATNAAVRVTVKKLSFYSARVSVVVTIANLGTGFVTVLPYGRSALRDELGHVFHPAKIDAAYRASRAFALGAHLAANEQFTGAIEFAVPRSDARAHTYSLTVAPNVRDGADAPFGVDVPNIDIPA